MKRPMIFHDENDMKNNTTKVNVSNVTRLKKQARYEQTIQSIQISQELIQIDKHPRQRVHFDRWLLSRYMGI